jgi:hypothetical protein
VQLGNGLLLFYHFGLNLTELSTEPISICVLRTSIVVKLILQRFDGIYLHCESFVLLRELEGDVLQLTLKIHNLILHVLARLVSE